MYCGDAGNGDGEVFKYPPGGSAIAVQGAVCPSRSAWRQQTNNSSFLGYAADSLRETSVKLHFGALRTLKRGLQEPVEAKSENSKTAAFNRSAASPS